MQIFRLTPDFLGDMSQVWEEIVCINQHWPAKRLISWKKFAFYLISLEKLTVKTAISKNHIVYFWPLSLPDYKWWTKLAFDWSKMKCNRIKTTKLQNNNLKRLTPDREAKQVFIVITDSITRYQAPICIDNLQSIKYKGWSRGLQHNKYEHMGTGISCDCN